MRLWLSALLASALLSSSGVIHATTGDTQQARQHAERALNLFEQGAYERAIEAFEQAERYYHAPPHVLYIARARVELGELLEAQRLLRAIVDESLAADAPKAFFRTQVQAREALDALDERIPVISVEVRGAGGRTPQLTVNGQPRVPGALSVDPGRYRLELVVGSERRSETVQVQEGERPTVRFDLSPNDEGVDSPWLVPAVVSYGVGGTALLTGLALGAASLSATADIDEQCQGDRCPSHLEDDAEKAKALGHASTALIVIAGLGAAAGTTFLLLGDGTDEPTVGIGWASAQLYWRF